MDRLASTRRGLIQVLRTLYRRIYSLPDRDQIVRYRHVTMYNWVLPLMLTLTFDVVVD